MSCSERYRLVNRLRLTDPLAVLIKHRFCNAPDAWHACAGWAQIRSRYCVAGAIGIASGLAGGCFHRARYSASAFVTISSVMPAACMTRER